jgi:hypothetical protein
VTAFAAPNVVPFDRGHEDSLDTIRQSLEFNQHISTQRRRWDQTDRPQANERAPVKRIVHLQTGRDKQEGTIGHAEDMIR